MFQVSLVCIGVCVYVCLCVRIYININVKSGKYRLLSI